MTDSRLKGEWYDNPRFDDLSDAAWRVFTNALMWCNQQGTDGAISQRYVDRCHPAGAQPAAYAELLEAKLWGQNVGGYELIDWSGELGQSAAAEVDERRRKNREKVAKWRKGQAVRADSGPGDVTGSVTGYVGPGPGPGSPKALNDKIEPPPFCEKHPRGTTDPCGDCMNARRAADHWRATRTTPSNRAHRRGDGHQCVADEYGYCPLCQERVPLSAASDVHSSPESEEAA